jgi:hypothetical protein
MPDLFSTETAGLVARPVVKPSTGAYGARPRRYRASITLAGQTTADNILLAIVPAGNVYSIGFITASVSLGASVIAIGTSKVHGTNGQLRAAGTFTAVETPTPFGLSAALAGAALLADTPIYLTIATANLPGAGTLVVDLNISNA